MSQCILHNLWTWQSSGTFLNGETMIFEIKDKPEIVAI